MNFDYEPLTEERALQERYQLLPDGKYKGYVERSLPKISSSNNAMAELTITIFDKDGYNHSVKDYLPFTKNMAWKMLHFCESASLKKEYDDRKFTPELAEGKNVIVELKTQMGKEIPEDKLNGKPLGSCYPAKNVINDYLIDNDVIENNVEKKEDFFNDTIPF